MDINRINLSQFNKILFSVFLVALILYLGKVFLIPIAIAAFFAMLLFPVSLKLQGYGLKKSLAALVSILLLMTILVFLGSVVYNRLAALQSDLPELEAKIEEKTNRLQRLLYQTTDLSENEQDAILKEKKPDIIKAIGKSLKNLLLQSLSILLQIIIVLTYTFFFLVYQHKIQNFFVKLKFFQNQRHSRVMLARIARIVHDYLKGTFIVIILLAVIYALGFWAIGIEHALLFALVTAILRIIPYFGSFLGIAFPIAFTILTKDSMWYPVLVLIFFMITQLLEANLLTPFITGSRVKLNPLVTIMTILLGNLLWGVPGMLLFMPFFGILKVILDEKPALHAYSYMLGKEE